MTNKKRPTRIYKRKKDSKSFYILKNGKRVKVKLPQDIETKQQAQKYIMDKLYTVLDDETITSYTQELPQRINYRYPSTKTRANRRASQSSAINNQAKAIRAYEAKLKEQQLEKEKVEAKKAELDKYNDEKRNTISRERNRKKEEAKKLAIKRDTLRLEEKKTNDLIQIERQKLQLLEEKQRRELKAEKRLMPPQRRFVKKPVDNPAIIKELKKIAESPYFIPNPSDYSNLSDATEAKVKEQKEYSDLGDYGSSTEYELERERENRAERMKNKDKAAKLPPGLEHAIVKGRREDKKYEPLIIDEPLNGTDTDAGSPYEQEEVNTKAIPKGLKERGLPQNILAINRASEKILGQSTDEEDSEEKGQSGEGSSSKLPALYSDEIDSFFEKEPRYTGTIASDQISELPKQIPQGFIINSDMSYEPGAHWRAVYITPDSIEWFDPFGDPPTQEEKIALKKKLIEWEVPNLMKFKINRIKQQHGNSHHCGYHCLMFLSNRFDGIDFPMATRYGNGRAKKDNHKQGEATIKKEFSYI